MRTQLRRRRVQVALALILIPILIIFGFGIYVAGMAGDLPWQVDPTRVSTSLTPFAGIPGFSAPTAVPTEAPAASSPAAGLSIVR